MTVLGICAAVIACMTLATITLIIAIDAARSKRSPKIF